ncbi:uncharacterized protein [Branchiostoma lanceolatum]|uniref:uncharacterized protein isoform X1 n=1 Tax=Branchiostoma lanceolatum TaxID=7740 RepID=UPI0034516FFF
MSELSSTRHCSTVVEDANTSHDSKVDSNGPQHPPASAHGRDGEELKTDSPARIEDHDTDSDRQDGKVGVAPPLGEREKYHVFFCYSSADAPWVKDMIHTLESDKFGFKCCIHERDFTPGAFIIKNIARSIQESQKTVFVLSRDFVESRWCDFERQLVMSENLTEENRKVIPVMLHKCDLLPDFLRHMTYLEAWTPYFINRFIGALKAEPGCNPDPSSTFNWNPNYNNGQHVLKMEPERTWEIPCCRFDEQILPSKLMSRGIRVKREDAVAVIKTLMMTGKMAFYDWYYSMKGHIAKVVAIMFILIIASINFPYLDEQQYYHPLAVTLPKVSTCSWTILGSLMLYLIPRHLMNKSMPRTMVGVNKILAKYHILATVTEKYLGVAKVVLHFVYYERGSCLLQIQEDLMARATQDPSSVEVNIQDDITDQVAEADALLLKYSDLFARLLVNKQLPWTRRSRGHIQQDTCLCEEGFCFCWERACLCQLVEMHEFGWKLDCVEVSEVDFAVSWSVDCISSCLMSLIKKQNSMMPLQEI